MITITLTETSARNLIAFLDRVTFTGRREMAEFALIVQAVEKALQAEKPEASPKDLGES